ncbi:hypothetical protein EV137_0003 [Kribbella pratensis]|uniref:UTRA domain-containing protein n=1 Tax=Kribbella pratensis TaxID=2512112 RepID=A0ABY2FI04_9ACTN|nr:hypothetical protein [Kribbella pratensis]TDW92743.1 hypothetical protein EV137_0003 [Kribbella pratensis]
MAPRLLMVKADGSALSDRMLRGTYGIRPLGISYRSIVLPESRQPGIIEQSTFRFRDRHAA